MIIHLSLVQRRLAVLQEVLPQDERGRAAECRLVGGQNGKPRPANSRANCRVWLQEKLTCIWLACGLFGIRCRIPIW